MSHIPPACANWHPYRCRLLVNLWPHEMPNNGSASRLLRTSRRFRGGIWRCASSFKMWRSSEKNFAASPLDTSKETWCLRLNCLHCSHTGPFVCVAEPLSSVSSLEVHFDLLDLTELTDMSDQELAEVFVDSDEENHNEPRAGESEFLLLLLCPLPPLPFLLPPLPLLLLLLDLDFNFASFACARLPAVARLVFFSWPSFKTKSVAGSAFCTLNLMVLGSFFPN